jgi:hypothetical protein
LFVREYGKIHSSFWTSRDIRSMTEDGRTLAAYLLTSPHSNMLGCFRIPPAYVSEDLGWDMERVRKGFAELFAKGWATLSEGSNWIVIHKFLKWNQPENPNVVKAAEKLFDQIPDECGAKPYLAWSIAEFEPRFSPEKLARFKPFSNPFDISRKAYRKPEPEPEPNQEPEPEPIPEPTNTSLSLIAPAEKKPDPVPDIFAFWQKLMNSPRSVLDANRRRLIVNALKNYTPAQVCTAIRGCSRSEWHMGANDAKKRYNGLDLILRNAEKIDSFIAMDSTPPAVNGGRPMTAQDRIREQNEATRRAYLGEPEPLDEHTIDMEH